MCACVSHLSECVLQVLERGGAYPQVILPEFGGYWIEDPDAPPPADSRGKEEVEDEEAAPGDYGYRLEEINEAARAYRKHFLGRVRCGGLNPASSFAVT